MSQLIVPRFATVLDCSSALLDVTKFKSTNPSEDPTIRDPVEIVKRKDITINSSEFESIAAWCGSFFQTRCEDPDHPCIKIYLDTLTDYVHKNYPQAKKGDLVTSLPAQKRYRNDGLFVYCDNQVVLLEDDLDEYEHIPKSFDVSSEFPLDYFHCDENKELNQPKGLDHNRINFFEFKPEWFDQVIASLSAILEGPNGSTVGGSFEAPANLVNIYPADSTETIKITVTLHDNDIEIDNIAVSDEDLSALFRQKIVPGEAIPVNCYIVDDHVFLELLPTLDN
jgi:hypothetical protein